MSVICYRTFIDVDRGNSNITALSKRRKGSFEIKETCLNCGKGEQVEDPKESLGPYHIYIYRFLCTVSDPATHTLKRENVF